MLRVTITNHTSASEQARDVINRCVKIIRRENFAHDWRSATRAYMRPLLAGLLIAMLLTYQWTEALVRRGVWSVEYLHSWRSDRGRSIVSDNDGRPTLLKNVLNNERHFLHKLFPERLTRKWRNYFLRHKPHRVLHYRAYVWNLVTEIF